MLAPRKRVVCYLAATPHTRYISVCSSLVLSQRVFSRFYYCMSSMARRRGIDSLLVRLQNLVHATFFACFVSRVLMRFVPLFCPYIPCLKTFGIIIVVAEINPLDSSDGRGVRRTKRSLLGV